MNSSNKISQSKRTKKRILKKYISGDAFKNATLYQKPFWLTQKQIKSKNLTMTMEDVEKDVIPMSFCWVFDTEQKMKMNKKFTTYVYNNANWFSLISYILFWFL